MWSKLLSPNRTRSSDPRPDDLRSPFESDRDRIIFSPSFRRLQDKTQVFPLEPHDFVRTRLTHSLEVAALGRSLGLEIGRWLVARDEVSPEQGHRDIPTLVETACLAHDLGNPPFGHSGEEAIRSWFRQHIEEPAMSALDAWEREDLLRFEGNAQGFRILTRLQRLHDEHGLNLTLSTLATFTKYPAPAIDRDRSLWGQKFGFYKSEARTFSRVAEPLGLTARRHPLAYLMEAADDLAYRIIDVEDAVRKGLLDVRTVHDRLSQVPSEDDKLGGSLDAAWKRFTNKANDPDAEQALMHDLRLTCTRVLFRSVVEAFQQHYEQVLEGRFPRALMDASDAHLLAQELLQLGIEFAYTNDRVVELELQGHRTIHTLLDRFVPACLAPPERRENRRFTEGKLYALLSRNQRYLYEQNPTEGSQPYRAIQLACDFVSGMTDSYALRMARL